MAGASPASSLGALPARITARLDRLPESRYALLSFLPAAIPIALFVLPPIVAVFAMSLFRIEIAKDDNMPFVGLRNYQRALSDSDFLAAVPRTLVYALGTTALSVPLGLAVALLVNRGFRGAGLLGIAVLIPWAVAPVVTGFFWEFIFESRIGIINGIAMGTGLSAHPIPWLESTATAVGVAVLATAWRSVPLLAILLLAALRTIPESLYRAARMDGAGTFQAFRYVTLPAIRNTLLVVSILQVIVSLQVFDLLYLLTGGGPGSETTTMNYFTYNKVVLNSSFGYSAALAVLLLALIVICSAALLYLRLRHDAGPAASDDAAMDPPPNRARLRATTLTAVKHGDVHESIGRRRLPRPTWLLRWLGIAGAGALVFWLLAPVAWIAITSIQPEGAVTQAPPALTTDVSLDRYATLLADPDWPGSFAVSLIVTLSATAITLLLGAIAAYPLARYRLPGKAAVMSLLIFTQMVPAIVLAIPVLLIFQRIGLKDTVAGLVLINVAWWLPLIVWLLRNVFEDVPRSIEAAARIDGCSRLGTLFRITVPAAAPGISAAAILLLIGVWNEFLFAVVLGDRNAVTVTRRISQTQAILPGAGVPPFTVEAAAGILVALPCIVLVALFHRRVFAGLTQGFVKG
jgi:ABC-type sugar transport system permease subunit